MVQPTNASNLGLVDSFKYWPYGDRFNSGQIPLQRLSFAAMERDPENNHLYDHARHHDFNVARFVSPDKVGGEPDDPQTWNRYCYARGNPLRYVDRDGRSILDVALGFAAEFASTLVLGAVPVQTDNPDFRRGQDAADLASVGLAGAEEDLGAAAEVLGLAAAPETGGGSLVLSGAGVGVELHAIGMATVATIHLASRSGGSDEPKGAHTSNQTPSNREVHQKGNERRIRDQGGEKKEKKGRMPYRRTDKKKGSLPVMPHKPACDNDSARCRESNR